MSRATSSLYGWLPGPVRSVAASAHGLRLRVRRYDRGLEGLVEAALEREYWGPAEWERFTARSLESVFEAAAATRYYSTLLNRVQGVDLAQIPITPRDAVRREPDAFWSSTVSTRRLVAETTSGTSGSPLRLRFTREAVREWFALIETRMRRWNGLQVSDRWAMLGGQVVVPVRRTEPPFWVHNWPMHQLYVSTHHISRRNAPAIAEALCRFKPRYLLGYPSSIALLARYALEDGLRLPEFAVVLSNAEMLTPDQRATISTAFEAPVRNTYGMAEAVAGASECEHGTMHQWPEVGIVETADGNGGVISTPGAAGPLVLTGLLNPAMPLLRYEIGDRGTTPTPSTCRCGRTLPVLGDIDGRSTDFIITPDDRHVFWINPVFRDLPIAEAQVVQHSRHDIEARIVEAPGWTTTDHATLIDRFAQRLGPDITIRITPVDTIERDPSGKFRTVISHVTDP